MTEPVLEPIEVRSTDFSEPAVAALVHFHLEGMFETSPADAVFALGLESLRSEDIRGFAAWSGSELLGIGALRIRNGYGEVKSMRTAHAGIGRGVGSAILRRIEAQACGLGLSALKLETGPPPHFLAANRFYEKHGYRLCGPFGEYRENEHSVFYVKELT